MTATPSVSISGVVGRAPATPSVVLYRFLPSGSAEPEHARGGEVQSSAPSLADRAFNFAVLNRNNFAILLICQEASR